jgi:hypothetical protein
MRLHFFWREDYKAEGDKEEGGENVPDLFTTPVPSGAHNAYQHMGSNWIWIQESFDICKGY